MLVANVLMILLLGDGALVLYVVAAINLGWPLP